jgi:hypothetical protein
VLKNFIYIIEINWFVDSFVIIETNHQNP